MFLPAAFSPPVSVAFAGGIPLSSLFWAVMAAGVCQDARKQAVSSRVEVRAPAWRLHRGPDYDGQRRLPVRDVRRARRDCKGSQGEVRLALVSGSTAPAAVISRKAVRGDQGTACTGSSGLRASVSEKRVCAGTPR